MTVVWLLFISSLVLLPGMALLAFRWALRHGEFTHVEKSALSIFDDEEPVGEMTDHFPRVTSRRGGNGPALPSESMSSPGNDPGPTSHS